MTQKSEYYAVLANCAEAVISKTARTYGEENVDVLLFDLQQPGNGHKVVQYEIQRYCVRHGIPPRETDSLYTCAVFAAEEHPEYFGPWEIDQTGFDDLDTYTCGDLYGVERYNFPLLYQYWDYRTQTYADPAGGMPKDEVIDYIIAHGEPETVLLSVRAYSQRYMVSEKYDTGDYNMENLFFSGGVMDNHCD